MTELQEFPHEGQSVMGEGLQLPCDINLDGNCDDLDQQDSYALAGLCFDDEGFNSFMDIDGDGCITKTDFDWLFPESDASDSDGDNMPDVWETLHNLNKLIDDSGEDLDGDGLTNLEEYNYLTDPNNFDTDGDGYSDGDEILAGTNPLKAEDTSTPNQQPIANAGEDQTFECSVPYGVSATLNGSESYDLDGDTLSYMWEGSFGTTMGVNPTVSLPLEISTINLVVNDGQINSAPDTVLMTVQDTTPPDLQIPANIIKECSGPNGQEINVGVPVTSDICSANITISNDAPILFVLGSTNVNWSAADEFRNISQDVQTVNINDTTSPKISLVCSPDILWPPNHKMMEIIPTVTASDICDASLTIGLEQIIMSEGEESVIYNSSNNEILDDIQVDSNGRIYLRAERSGKSIEGRVYTIIYRATDASGNTAVASCEVSVPHDKGK